ncbi:MAG: winged helix-turn-helix domain-containing protein [Candidatus Odinarchaeota archaeon]
MTSENFRNNYKGIEIESEYTLQNETKPLKNGINSDLLQIDKNKPLRGKTLQIYWYILTHKYAGVREIQKALNFSSPGTVSYQLKKLSNAGIISKDIRNEKYYVNEELKKGLLGFYVRIGYFMIPRFLFYLIFYILGFIGYLIFAGIYGENFITNPGSLLLLFFLIFGTVVFIFEYIKMLKRKPAKVK